MTGTGTSRRSVATLAVVALLAVAFVSACSGGSGGSGAPATSTTVVPVPGATWEKVAPAQVGLNAAKLEEIAHQAEAGKSNCLVVARDGKIAGEWYFRGTGPHTAQDVFSVTKSISSTLVGIAADDGDLNIGDRASTWIPEWKGTAANAVTVRDLLSNDSGRKWSIVTDYVQLLKAKDRTVFAIGLPQTSAPGTVWAYNNSAIQTLQPVVQQATGTEVTEFAAHRLLDPIGMTDSEMTKDSSGHAQMFEGLQSTCRDLARFGELFLNRGRWGAHQIVSSTWVAEATGRASTKLNAAYGYLWWLNRSGVVAGPLAATDLAAAANPTTTHGRLVPGAPANLFWALGLGNQVVQVDPGTKTVVVRLGTAETQPKPPTFGPKEAARVVTEAVTGPVK